MSRILNKNIIFVGGIHGVGKTTLCNKVAKSFQIEHYSSSELISKLNSNKVKENKKVSDVKENQNILLEAVNKYLCNNKNYLLDGHFCLINDEGNIEEIPTNIFKALKVKEIIVLIDQPEEIFKKLISRDSRMYSLDFIKNFQEREVSHGKYVAKQMNIDYKIINVSWCKNKILRYFSNIV